MTDVSLAELLASVASHKRDAEGDGFRVSLIQGFERHYVGRDAAGQPSLLLGSDAGAFHPPVRLAMLEARFGNWHRIDLGNGERREECLSVITCTSRDIQVQAYFLHVGETILRIIRPIPSLDDIVQVVQRLIEMFRRLARPAPRSLNGLFGELFLIAVSRNVVSSVAAWRNCDNERFDFSVADVRLDVKSSAQRSRVHHLSAEQCQPPVGTVGLLASLFIESSGGGKSLSELIAMIEARLVGRDDLILKIQENIAGSLGESLSAAMTARFDDRLALASLRFYDLAKVPAIRDGIPPEVNQVHFRSDLSYTDTLSENVIQAMSEMAIKFLPR